MFLRPLLIFLTAFMFSPTLTFANYAVGAFSQHNSIEEFVDSEKKFGIKYHIIGFIFDTFTEADARHVERAVQVLGKDRVYHVSISPLGLTAKQVANGEYDASYRRFFAIVKKTEAKFVFRTMHEMNGSWYSWSGDPVYFKKAWKRIHELSRENGLSQSNILFVFSANSQDLPSKGNVLQGEMIYCTPEIRVSTHCLAMEDYYPGKEYVDLVGITLYNWGRGRSDTWARWKTFEELLIDPKTKMYERLLSYDHPMIVDEVGTTAVNFTGPWSAEKAIDMYQTDKETKNTWLRELRQTLQSHPKIVGFVYFNRDKTQGLTDRSLIGELDWSVSSVHVGKVYEAYFEFFKDPLSTSKALPFARGYTEEEVRLPRPELSKKIRAYWEKVLSELQIFVQKELKNNFSFQKNRLF